MTNIDKKYGRWGQVISDETRRKMSISATGRKHTEETKRKIGLATASRTPGMLGKKVSEETKRKIRLAKVGMVMKKSKYTEEYLNSVYNPLINVYRNSIENGKFSPALHRVLVQHIVKNNLPCVPNQLCIKRYKEKHGIV